MHQHVVDWRHGKNIKGTVPGHPGEKLPFIRYCLVSPQTGVASARRIDLTRRHHGTVHFVLHQTDCHKWLHELATCRQFWNFDATKTFSIHTTKKIATALIYLVDGDVSALFPKKQITSRHHSAKHFVQERTHLTSHAVSL